MKLNARPVQDKTDSQKSVWGKTKYAEEHFLKSLPADEDVQSVAIDFIDSFPIFQFETWPKVKQYTGCFDRPRLILHSRSKDFYGFHENAIEPLNVTLKRYRAFQKCGSRSAIEDVKSGRSLPSNVCAASDCLVDQQRAESAVAALDYRANSASVVLDNASNSEKQTEEDEVMNTIDLSDDSQDSFDHSCMTDPVPLWKFNPQVRISPIKIPELSERVVNSPEITMELDDCCENSLENIVGSYDHLNHSGEVVVNDGGCLNHSGELVINNSDSSNHSGELLSNDGDILNKPGELVSNGSDILNHSDEVVISNSSNQSGEVIMNDIYSLNQSGELIIDDGDCFNNSSEFVINDSDTSNHLDELTINDSGCCNHSPEVTLRSNDCSNDLPGFIIETGDGFNKSPEQIALIGNPFSQSPVQIMESGNHLNYSPEQIVESVNHLNSSPEPPTETITAFNNIPEISSETINPSEPPSPTNDRLAAIFPLFNKPPRQLVKTFDLVGTLPSQNNIRTVRPLPPIPKPGDLRQIVKFVPIPVKKSQLKKPSPSRKVTPEPVNMEDSHYRSILLTNDRCTDHLYASFKGLLKPAVDDETKQNGSSPLPHNHLQPTEFIDLTTQCEETPISDPKPLQTNGTVKESVDLSEEPQAELDSGIDISSQTQMDTVDLTSDDEKQVIDEVKPIEPIQPRKLAIIFKNMPSVGYLNVLKYPDGSLDVTENDQFPKRSFPSLEVLNSFINFFFYDRKLLSKEQLPVDLLVVTPGVVKSRNIPSFNLNRCYGSYTSPPRVCPKDAPEASIYSAEATESARVSSAPNKTSSFRLNIDRSQTLGQNLDYVILRKNSPDKTYVIKRVSPTSQGETIIL